MKLSGIVGNRYGIVEDEPHFGIEIEVENVTIPQEIVMTNWETIPDGSLREGGMEFLSATPWRRGTVRRNLQYFYRWMEEFNFATSIRTSTHVHVNALGHTIHEIAAACVVYTLVEPIMFRYCGKIREENIYCVPWYRATDELLLVQQLAHGTFASLPSAACKYSALYLEPVLRFGTMEFRQAPVFETEDELLTWVGMCERVCYSGFTSVEQVIDTYEELGADEFVAGIFGERITDILRGVCEKSFEDLLDEYDTLTAAESVLACTYKPTTWFVPEGTPVTDHTNGYCMYAEGRRRGRPMYDFQAPPEEMYYDDDYPIDEEEGY